MKQISTPIEGLVILEPRIFPDPRGYFFESFNQRIFQEVTGQSIAFVQDNQARSGKHVIRGLHFQKEPRSQTKLILALDGIIWDVVVDLRENSLTYGHWFGVELSAANKRQFLIPAGFAHGYSVLSENAEVFYKCDQYYDPSAEGGLMYNDPDLNIDWKIDMDQAIISEKDLKHPLLKDL